MVGLSDLIEIQQKIFLFAARLSFKNRRIGRTYKAQKRCVSKAEDPGRDLHGGFTEEMNGVHRQEWKVERNGDGEV